jgi:hypothetical protein
VSLSFTSGIDIGKNKYVSYLQKTIWFAIYLNWLFIGIFVVYGLRIFPIFTKIRNFFARFSNPTKLGLIFDVKNGKFYLDKNRTGIPDKKYIYKHQKNKWKWDSATNTLTLEGFKWKTMAEIALRITDGDLKINLKGENTFISAAVITSCGIDARYREITLEGDGTLEAEATAISTVGEDTKCGIYLKSLVIKGGKLEATGGDATNNSYGICANKVKVNGGTLRANSGIAKNSYGIFINDNNAENELSIVSGEVKVHGHTKTIQLADKSSQFKLPSAYNWDKSQNYDGSGGTPLYNYPHTPFEDSDNPKYIYISRT